MNIPQILQRLHPDAEWVLHGDDYDGLTWLSEGPAPTEAELAAAWPAVEESLAVDEVHRQRAAAYREEADGLFFEAQRGEAPLEVWEAKVAEIKLRFPLP